MNIEREPSAAGRRGLLMPCAVRFPTSCMFGIACVVVVLAGVAHAAGSPPRTTLLLSNGNALTGEVLRERADAVIVDLGFTVITVPGDLIVERHEATGESRAGVGEGQAEEGLYHVASPGSLPERTVRELSAELGAAVVLVATPAGVGSGFVIHENGYVVTNFHVVAGEQEISVTVFRDDNGWQERVKLERAKIIAINPWYDLALLKVSVPESMKLKYVCLGSSESVRDGQSVFAIGNPLGLERSVSEGIVSATRRNLMGQIFLQTTAPLNPGNSGGPLFNLRGEVIGVTNMKAGPMTEGMSFAVPVDTLKFFLRNRDVFAFDKDNPNTGYHYLPPPRRASVAPRTTGAQR